MDPDIAKMIGLGALVFFVMFCAGFGLGLGWAMGYGERKNVITVKIRDADQ